MHWFKKVVTPRETKAPKTARAAEWGRATCAPTPGRSGPEGPVARSAGVAVEGDAGRQVRDDRGVRVDGGEAHRAAALESGHLVCPFGLWGARGPDLAHTVVLAYKHTSYFLCL